MAMRVDIPRRSRLESDELNSPSFGFRADKYSKIPGFETMIECVAGRPSGLAINQRGELHVCHFYGDLCVYDEEYKLLKRVVLPFHAPTQMAFAPTGELLIAFQEHAAAAKAFDGDSLEELMDIGLGLIMSAVGITASKDRVFISDGHEHVVQAFSLEDGTWVASLAGYFYQPSGLAIVEDRLLAVVDRGSNVVKLVSLEMMKQVGQVGWKELMEPNDIAVDVEGNLLVMDTGHERIAVFSSQGTFVASVMPGNFKNYGTTYSYLACNMRNGHVLVSVSDANSVGLLNPHHEYIAEQR
jgi:sugar lactone lactonase YvrE